MTDSKEISVYEDSSSFEDTSYEINGVHEAILLSQNNLIKEQMVLMNIFETSAINEGASSFLSNIKDALAAFIRFLVNLVKKFFDKLISYIDDDRFIMSNLNEIESIGPFKFHTKGFNFTFYSSSVSDVFDKMAEEVTYIASQCTRDHTPEDIIAAISRFKNANLINNTTEYYDFIRGKFLANKYGAYVSVSDFDSKAYKSFRDNEKHEIQLTIDRGYLGNVIKALRSPKTAYDALKQDVQNEINRCEKSIVFINKAIEIIFRRISTMDGGSKAETNALTSAYSLYIKLSNSIDQLNNMARIYFGIRMDAIRDKAIQDKRIVREAIFKYKNFKRGLA